MRCSRSDGSSDRLYSPLFVKFSHNAFTKASETNNEESGVSNMVSQASCEGVSVPGAETL